MSKTIDIEKFVELGDRLQVQVENEQFHSNVQDVESAGHLIISPLQIGEGIHYFPPGTVMDLAYFRPDALYSFSAQLTDIVKRPDTGLTLLRVRALTSAHRHQRRESFRLPVLLEVRLWMEQEIEGERVPISQKGTTLDLSSGGMRLQVEQPPAQGDTVHVDLPLGDQVLTLIARVCRINEPQERSRYYSLGLEFVNPPMDATKKITRFLLSRQAAMRRQGR